MAELMYRIILGSYLSCSECGLYPGSLPIFGKVEYPDSGSGSKYFLYLYRHTGFFMQKDSVKLFGT
jgi:hypothetical protein